MSIPWIIALCVGLATFGAGWLIYGYHIQVSSQMRRQRQFKRLEKLTYGSDSGISEADRLLEKPWFERLALLLSGRLQGNSLLEQDSEERRLLARAGYRGVQALVTFQSLRLFFVVVVLLIFASYALVLAAPLSWLKVALAGGFAYLAPRMVLRHLGQRRIRRIANELPLFIDYLRMMHGSGVSIEQSMSLFAEETRVGLPVLASEFNVVRLAIKSGRSRSDALQQMAWQIDLADLSELISLINDTDRYGAGLQEPLKLFSIRLAERRRLDMQEYIGKLATKMVVVMVLFLLPALIMITAGPGFVAVFRALSEIT